MHTAQRYPGFRRLGLVLTESTLLTGCVFAAVRLRLYYQSLGAHDLLAYLPKAFTVALIFQLFLHLCDVYDFERTRTLLQLGYRLGRALLLCVITLAFLYYALPDLLLWRGTFAIALVLMCAFLVVWHAFLRIYLDVRPPQSNLLVLGTGRLAKELVAEILKRPELGIRVCGFLDPDPAMKGKSIVNPRVVGSPAELTELVAAQHIDRIAVEMADRRGQMPVDELLKLKLKGVAVEEATSLYERVAGRIPIVNLKPSWMIFNGGFEVSRARLLQKRILSIVASLVLLIFFSPFLLLLALLIKLDSPGPVFYPQERVGKDGKIFTLYKLRSMYQDAEKHTGPVWADRSDPRVTRMGRIMRRLRLDEVPQLFNVLRGDMSLVGPRPERPRFVRELSSLIPFYDLRHSVKPGLTGWAQIHFGYANSVHDAVEKLQYDLFYIKNMSPMLDLVILFETAKTVLVRRGS